MYYNGNCVPVHVKFTVCVLKLNKWRQFIAFNYKQPPTTSAPVPPYGPYGRYINTDCARDWFVTGSWAASGGTLQNSLPQGGSSTQNSCLSGDLRQQTTLSK
jgi:hypothetical protein